MDPKFDAGTQGRSCLLVPCTPTGCHPHTVMKMILLKSNVSTLNHESMNMCACLLCNRMTGVVHKGRPEVNVRNGSWCMLAFRTMQ